MKNLFIRIFAGLLCLAVLIPAAVSCGTTGDGSDTTAGGNDPSDSSASGDVTSSEDETTEPTVTTYEGVELAVADYKIVRPDVTTDTVTNAASDLLDAFKQFTGKSPKLATDWVKEGTPIPSDTKEILVGNTNRPETAEVVAKLEGSMWGIAAVGNKIVIVGTSDVLTAAAVNFFSASYLSVTGADGKFRIPDPLEELSGQYEPVSLIENGKFKYKIIFKSGLDTTGNDNSTDRCDYPVQKVHELVDGLAKLTGINPGFGSDLAAASVDTSKLYEILVGDTSRAETKEFLKSIAPDKYGYGIVGNKIVVAGWSDTTTGLAVDEFLKLMKSCVVKDADGKVTNINIVYDKPVISTFPDIVTDFPQPDFVALSYCAELTDNGYEYYYTGADAAAFNSYKEKLKKAGYTEYFTNSMAKNLYASYTNASNALYVYFTDYDSSIRVIASPMKKTVLPAVTDTGYTKVTDTKFTQMTLNYPGNSGNCYIITLEDGSFIVYDGGAYDSTDTKRLYDTLTSLNARPDGKIVIAAWLLTHEHSDHYLGFWNFCQEYGDKVTIEQFICNTPTDVFAYNGRDIASKTYINSIAAASYGAGGFKVVKAHTGQRIAVRNVTIEVLFTIEDIFPKYLHIFNDASVVTRLYIGNQTVMMPGDAEEMPGIILQAMYPNGFLKSDIVQISHHGYGMMPMTFYALVGAKTAFWPSDRDTIAKLSNPATKSGYYSFGYKLQNSAGFEEIFVAGDGTKTITFPYVTGRGN